MARRKKQTGITEVQSTAPIDDELMNRDSSDDNQQLTDLQNSVTIEKPNQETDAQTSVTDDQPTQTDEQVTELRNIQADDSKKEQFDGNTDLHTSVTDEPLLVPVEKKRKAKSTKVQTSVTTEPTQTPLLDQTSIPTQDDVQAVIQDTDSHTSVIEDTRSDNQDLVTDSHTSVTERQKIAASRTPYQRASFGDARYSEPFVSLTIKVPDSWREHWQIEVRKRRTSLSALVVEMLTDTLGLPESSE